METKIRRNVQALSVFFVTYPQLVMKERFSDLLELYVPEWLFCPFDVDVACVDANLQEALIDLQHDEESEVCFQRQGNTSFWLSQSQKYPALWTKIKQNNEAIKSGKTIGAPDE